MCTVLTYLDPLHMVRLANSWIYHLSQTSGIFPSCCGSWHRWASSDHLPHKSNLKLLLLLCFTHRFPSTLTGKPLLLKFCKLTWNWDVKQCWTGNLFLMKSFLQQFPPPPTMVSWKDIKSAGICIETLQNKQEQALSVEPQTDKAVQGWKRGPALPSPLLWELRTVAVNVCPEKQSTD